MCRYRNRLRSVCLGWLVILLIGDAARADIFRWDNGQLIPGTEGITPGPGVQLDHRELSFATLHALDLSGANFELSNLSSAEFYGPNGTGGDGGSNLTGANFRGANLTNSHLIASSLAGADLTGANAANASFGSTTLTNAKATGANFSGASFIGDADLTNANFTGTNLTNALFGRTNCCEGLDRPATLTDVNFSGAVVNGASFGSTTKRGFSKEQLYSTASYQDKDLQRIMLWNNDLSGWDLSGQNLTNSRLGGSTLTNANLSEANLTNADLSQTNLTSASFGFSTLAGADLSHANLTGANFVKNNLTGADFTDAVIQGARFANPIFFSKEQFYSTASYKAKNLTGIQFEVGTKSNDNFDMTGWDFSHQDLTGAQFCHGLQGSGVIVLQDANLTNSNLTDVGLFASFILLDRADARGAITRGSPSFELLVNMIQPDGRILLDNTQKLTIRDYDGDPGRELRGWGPDPGPIPVTVYGQMTLGTDAAIQLFFDADPWNSTIFFQPGIPVTLGGTLELWFATDVDVASQLGRTFDLFNWTSVNPTGQFQVASPYLWDLSNLYTSGEVTLLADVDANFNNDSAIDGADLLAWQLNFGLTDGALNAQGDADYDADVDGGDFLAWQQRLGSGAAMANSMRVPEPSVLTLVLLGLLTTYSRRRADK